MKKKIPAPFTEEWSRLSRIERVRLRPGVFLGSIDAVEAALGANKKDFSILIKTSSEHRSWDNALCYSISNLGIYSRLIAELKLAVQEDSIDERMLSSEMRDYFMDGMK